mgnify:CR=1 FL=1
MPFPTLNVTPGSGVTINTLPSAGQQAMANSLPVTLASDQSAIPVGGGAAHGATAAGNPSFLGVIGRTASANVTNGQITAVTGTLAGQITTWPWAIPENSWSYVAASGGIVNTTTAVTIKAAAAAGIRNYLTKLVVATETLGTATEIAIRDGAAGPVLFRTKLHTTALPTVEIDFDPPLRGTAATLLEIVTLTATTTGGVFVNARGFVAP